MRTAGEVMPIVLIVVTHLVVPVALIGSLAHAASKLAWLAGLVLATVYLAFIHLAGTGWPWLGGFWPYVFWIGLAGVIAWFCWRRLPRLPGLPARSVRSWFEPTVAVAVSLFLASSAIGAFGARTFEEAAAPMVWPLPNGRYHIVHGGSSEVVNHHFRSAAQRYALDTVESGPFGLRARGLYPKTLDAYHIWSAPVVAPCEGRVVAAQTGLPDRVPPDADADRVAGNYVAIHCEGVTVVLAHLRRSSLRVREGDHVTSGQTIAAVGNSGNTSEPHLHMHAVRGRTTGYEELMWNGEGVPLTFGGTFPVRNDTIRAEPAA